MSALTKTPDDSNSSYSQSAAMIIFAAGQCLQTISVLTQKVLLSVNNDIIY